MKLYLSLICLLLFCACKTVKPVVPTKIASPIYDWMSGSYNSETQSLEDSTYYNISLHMYPVWTDKAGHWLYVEQALNTKQDEPYRIRMYELIDLGNNKFESKVYKLKDEEQFIGKWKSPRFFNDFSTDILEEREGCSVYLSLQQDRFTGSTKEDFCKSTLRGASYASSKVTVFSHRIESWDQGFDADGKQVWGAMEGPYVFDKIQMTKPE